MITNSKYASAYIDVEPELLVRSFLFVLGVMTLAALVSREVGVDIGVEVPGADVGVTTEGGVHDLWLGTISLFLQSFDRRRGGRSPLLLAVAYACPV